MNIETQKKLEDIFALLCKQQEFIADFNFLIPSERLTPILTSSYKDREFETKQCRFIIRDWNQVCCCLTAENVTAVAALPVLNNNKNKIVLSRNRRGWDIAGGHLETGETMLGALIRELNEETGCSCLFAYPLMVLESLREKQATFIPIFMARVSEPDPAYQRANEISEIKVVGIDQFLSMYHGNSIFAKAVVEACLLAEFRQ